ncbi:MAG: thiamine diphosphokinase [Clostridia bacterium]|nr:thiamine diphosphokinase [Clostridia bacterium]
MRTLIVLGGDLPDTGLLERACGWAELVIAADRGLEAFRDTARLPDLLLGDMDSVSGDVLSRFESLVPERRLPCMKDDTDGQDALKTALGRGAQDIVFLGALGGRLDHALGNLSLLMYAAHRGVRARIMGDGVTIEAVREALAISGNPGDTVSVMPIGTATGVTLSGFQYPLVDGTLYAENTLGISNVLMASAGTIRVASGDVLVFHYHPGRNGF